MDRGIPTEETLKDLAARGGEYVVGTPKGRLTKLESAFAQKPWQSVRDKVRVKLLEEEEEVIVFVESDDRVLKERSMRQRRVRKLLKRLASQLNVRVAAIAEVFSLNFQSQQAQSFKSDGKPGVAHKPQRWEDAVRAAGITGDEAARLLHLEKELN